MAAGAPAPAAQLAISAIAHANISVVENGLYSELGNDLVLLSVDPRRARIAHPAWLSFGLHGAELVILAAAGRISLDRKVTVLSDEPTGDGLADRALAAISASRWRHEVSWWIRRGRRRIVDEYLSRLAAEGTIRIDRKLLRDRLRITDPDRRAQARARLDAITWGSTDLEAAALGGLVCAIALDRDLYRGRVFRSRHRELKQIGNRRWWCELFESGPEATLADTIGAVIRAVGRTWAEYAAS